MVVASVISIPRTNSLRHKMVNTSYKNILLKPATTCRCGVSLSIFVPSAAAAVS